MIGSFRNSRKFPQSFEKELGRDHPEIHLSKRVFARMASERFLVLIHAVYWYLPVPSIYIQGSTNSNLTERIDTFIHLEERIRHFQLHNCDYGGQRRT